MHFVVAIAVLIAVGFIGTPLHRVTYTVESVASDSPAQLAGLRSGDVLLAVNDVVADTPEVIQVPRGIPAELHVQRASGEIVGPIVLTPRTDPPPAKGRWG